MQTRSTRRRFLALGSGAASALFLASPISKALAASCGLTPAQMEGPFYPGETNFVAETDLTWIPGHTERAKGQVVYVRGKVLDPACRPIAGANVEIWQACASGKYDSPKDPNPAPRDPNFRYWSEAYTAEDGSYVFKTIIPGAYPASASWDRPPHIHVRVAKLGYRELITQMYFKGHPLNDADAILQDLPSADRARVVVDFQPSTPDLEPGTLTGEFDITIRPIG